MIHASSLPRKECGERQCSRTLDAIEEALVDHGRFDVFTKRYATDTSSRRRLIAAALGAAGGSLLGLRRTRDAAAAACAAGDLCDGNTVPCGKDGRCVCYRAIDGGRVCAAARGTCRTECDSDRDCKRGDRCVKNGRKCCGGKLKGVCARACP
jgi:hypothetical protein